MLAALAITGETAPPYHPLDISASHLQQNVGQLEAAGQWTRADDRELHLSQTRPTAA